MRDIDLVIISVPADHFRFERHLVACYCTARRLDEIEGCILLLACDGSVLWGSPMHKGCVVFRLSGRNH